MTTGEVDEVTLAGSGDGSAPTEVVETPRAGSAGRSSGSRLRSWYRLVTVVAVAPITVSAVRHGLAGWEPSWDVATTVVRIRDVFSAHPPLTGMAAAPSVGTDAAYSFPGALHLYLLAVPVRVLGTTWGVLVGMAAINTAVCLLALWLLRRRLGERWAMVGALFLTALLWTVGSGTPIYPTPLAIGVVPLFAFLVAAWSVADGDPPAVLVFAVLANHLFLNQLVFIVVVPVVGAVAVTLGVTRAWRVRHLDRVRWRARRRAHVRWSAAAVAVTVAVWVPPLVDQFFLPGGNLGKLVHAFTSGEVAHAQGVRHTPSPTGALGVVASVTAVPRAWLPPSFATVPFDADGGGASFVVGLAWSLVLFGLLGWGAWRAHRRGDSRVTSAVAIAATGWVAYVLTAAGNPDAHGYLQRYFLGLWPLGAFMWLVALVGLVTAWPGLASRLRRWSARAPVAGLAVTLVVAASATRRTTNAPAMMVSKEHPLAANVRQTASTVRLGRGPVLVESDRATRRLVPSVMLGLQDAGVEFRVPGPFDAQQFGAWRSEFQQRDAATGLRIGDSLRRRPGERLVSKVSPAPVLGDAEFDRLDRHMRAWITQDRHIRVNRDWSTDRNLNFTIERYVDDLIRTSPDGGLSALDDPAFVRVIAAWGRESKAPMFMIPGLTGDDLDRWAREKRRDFDSVYLFAAPLR